MLPRFSRLTFALFAALLLYGVLFFAHDASAAAYSSPFTNCFRDSDCGSVNGYCRNRVCFSPANQAPPTCADRCANLPNCPPGSTTCGGHTVSAPYPNPGDTLHTIHVTDCRGIGTGFGGGVISYCSFPNLPPPTPTPKPPTPTPTPPAPTAPPGTLQDGRITGVCKGWPNPYIEIRWSQNPPPGSQPKNSNSVIRRVNGQTGQWFYAGGNPGVFATRINGTTASPWGAGGYPAPNYNVYDLRDGSVQPGSSYEYVAKYRAETASVNTYSVTVNAANCGGGSPPAPTPTSGTGDGRISGYCTWVNGGPRVHLSWSQNPPPGVTATVNALQKGDCYPSDPGNYWCFLNINSNQYSYTDTTTLEDTQYQYRAKYTPGNPSVNTYNIYTSAANCGAPPPSPAPLDISPDYQTVPPNVTALLTATGGDGSYAWSSAGGAISGSGATVGVVFTNNSTAPISRTVTVTSGNQSVSATIQVEGVQTYQDDITVRGLGSRYVFVDDNEPITSSSFTTLTLAHGFANEATASMTMKIGNTQEAAEAVAEQPFQQNLPWNLCDGLATCQDGLYTVYTIYRTSSGELSPVVTDNIVYAFNDAGDLPAVSINDGAATTTDRVVTLTLQSGFTDLQNDSVSMQIANTLENLDSAPTTFFSPSVEGWDLCAGTGSSCADGIRSVFVRFCHQSGCSTIVYDDIYFDSPWPDWGVRINNDAPATDLNDVQLSLNPWFDGANVQVFLSNTADFSMLASAAYADTLPWDLCTGLFTCDPANYTVYVRYIDGTGMRGWPSVQSPRYEDAIVLGATPTPTPTPLPAGVLIEDGRTSVDSRFVKLTLTSPFGTGADVSMRPINEEGLTKRDQGVIDELGGGIHSQPEGPRAIPPKPVLDTRQAEPLSPEPTREIPIPGTPTDAIQNRISQVDAGILETETPKLESGVVRKYLNELGGWDICNGEAECPYGTYKVFVQYYRTPGVVTAAAVLAALGDEISSVYYDTVEYVSPTPTPTLTPTPTVSGSPLVSPALSPPVSPTPLPTDTPIGDVIDALGAAGNTIGLVAMVSSVAVLMSALVTLGPLLSSAGAGAFAFAWQWFMGMIGLLPKRKKVWGTVYDANTKRPIPFAKVQLLDRNKRVLEIRVADKDGRYGFLTTPESLMAQNVQIQILPSAADYAFPSKASPSVDRLVYNNLYFGDLITVNDKTLINFDVPMDPLKPSMAPLLLKSPSIALGAAVAAIADAGFWLGVIMVPLNFIIAPNPFTLGVLFLFFGTASLRIWGISEHPFGVVKDTATGRPMAFALITLNDLSGRRVAFTVTDELGRYFLVVDKGTYEFNAFTPATIQPGRQSRSTIDARKGWITRELTL